MPTQRELAGLYNSKAGYQVTEQLRVHVTELIQLSGSDPWAADRKGPKAALFLFSHGMKGWRSPRGDGGGGRALPVRGKQIETGPLQSKGSGKKITNKLGMVFVYIPADTFTMGSPPHEPGRYRDEQAHQATLTRGSHRRGSVEKLREESR